MLNPAYLRNRYEFHRAAKGAHAPFPSYKQIARIELRFALKDLAEELERHPPEHPIDSLGGPL